MQDPIRVLVALGSNQGDSKNNVLKGFEALERLAESTVKRSSLWKSEPVNCPPGSPEYVNAAASFDISSIIQPRDFLEKLLTTEKELGRRRSGVVNEPRVIDLDLICYGSVQIKSPDLTLPHPRAHLREFVLAPLQEIEPGFLFPGINKTTKELLNIIPESGNCIRCAET